MTYSRMFSKKRIERAIKKIIEEGNKKIKIKYI